MHKPSLANSSWPTGSCNATKTKTNARCTTWTWRDASCWRQPKDSGSSGCCGNAAGCNKQSAHATTTTVTKLHNHNYYYYYYSHIHNVVAIIYLFLEISHLDIILLKNEASHCCIISAFHLTHFFLRVETERKAAEKVSEMVVDNDKGLSWVSRV